MAEAPAKPGIIKFSVDVLRKKSEPSGGDFWELAGQGPGCNG